MTCPALRPLLITLMSLSLMACATDVKLDPAQGKGSIQVQNKSLDPSNGGELVSDNALQTGDIIFRMSRLPRHSASSIG